MNDRGASMTEMRERLRLCAAEIEAALAVVEHARAWLAARSEWEQVDPMNATQAAIARFDAAVAAREKCA